MVAVAAATGVFSALFFLLLLFPMPPTAYGLAAAVENEKVSNKQPSSSFFRNRLKAGFSIIFLSFESCKNPLTFLIFYEILYVNF
jgi:hypothetical protein